MKRIYGRRRYVRKEGKLRKCTEYTKRLQERV